jgi:peptide/nickel transport system substrate-binding protein
MKRARRLVAAAAAVALVATACGDDGGDEPSGEETTSAAGETSSPTEDGGDDVDPANYCEGGGEAELVWAHEQEPPDMHLDDPNNNLTITSWVRQSLWDGLYGVSVETEFIPELLAEDAEPTENEDGSVTIDYTLRDGLTWSDGTPLTAEHVKGTFDIIMEGYDPETGEGGVYLIGDRTGYDVISEVTVASDTEFTIEFSEFFAGHKALFSEVFPTHVVSTAEEANAAFTEFEHDGETLPSSGPMLFDNWERGNSMTLTRNDDYHGSTSPDVTNEGVACVTGVRINWVADTDAQINALKAGEADFIMTQPQTAFGERISTDENFTLASQAGPIFEHWGLNLFDDHLQDPLVREALAYALDKSQVMSALYTPLFGDALDPEGLGNTYWLSNQPDYEDHQEQYAGAQAEEAKANLEEAGYTEGANGIYEHPERGPLSLRVGTTGGNALRELQQQLIVEQMKSAGIEVVIDNVPGGDYFSERPFSEDALACANSGGTEGNCDVWDITQFAWVGGPWPGGQSASYRTGSGNNNYGFANEEFDAKATECDLIVDDAERAACYNELDRYVTTLELDPEQGLFMLPLTQKPSFYAFSNQRLERGAVAPDANSAGPLVYVVDFVPAGDS